MKLRYYQKEAVDSVWYYFQANSGNPVIALPGGTGKSLVIAGLLKAIYSLYPNQRIMMLTHVKELIDQNFDKLMKIWPAAPAGIYSAGIGRKDTHCKITYAGIQSVQKKPELFGHIDLVLIDEAHLVSPTQTTSYRKFLKALKKKNPFVKVIGLTATPFRLGQGLITEGANSLFTDICYDGCNLEAFNKLLAEGFLSRLIPKRTSYEIDVSSVRLVAGEFNNKELQAATDREEITYRALCEAMEMGTDRKHWLVFGTGTKHCDHITAMLNTLGISAVSIHTEIGTKLRDQRINDFKAGKVQCAVNNNILSTGFDYPEIDFIIVLRPTNSPALWCLNEKTEVLTPTGFKSYNEISLNDEIIGFNKQTRSLIPTKVTGYIHRPLTPTEQLVEYNSRQFKFSMTDSHSVIYEQRSTNKTWDIRKNQLKHLTSKANRRMLISTITPQSGCGENKSILTLFGLYLSDGSFDASNNTLAIYQSERYMGICNELETILDGLNIGWRLYTRVPNTQFETKFKMRKYVISRTVRDKAKFGWNTYFNIEDFDKSLPDRFLSCNREEFEYLLRGINLGDGCKFESPLQKYKPKVMNISTGNKDFADRIQQLCLYTGYSCKIKKLLNSKDSFIYRMYINDKLTMTFKPGFIKEIPYTDQNVWCVENPTGNIVTRYDGQVLITGNCQMLSRGTRPIYGAGFDLSTAEGRIAAIASGPKPNCLVADFSGNTKRLGPINDPVIPRRKGKKGGGVAPVRLCPECNTYMHASIRICIECGYEFPIGVKFGFTAGKDELIADARDEPQVEVFQVDKVTYTPHNKMGSPPSIKATYHCGLRRFTEYICIEHGRFPAKRARDWWRQHRPMDPRENVPVTTQEAMDRLITLVEPTHIRVWINQKYPKIMKYNFTGGFDAGH